MIWFATMNLNPRELAKSDYDRWQELTKSAPANTEDWQKIAAFVIDAIGVQNAVQLGDIQLWRHAISQRSDGPLPPLNLPLSIWEAYLSGPFSAPIFHFADGSTKKVESWEHVFYCWHSRMLAMLLDESFVGFSAEQVVAVSRGDHAPSHTLILDRLNWFKNAQGNSPVCIRTKHGKTYLAEEPIFFNVDRSGSILAITGRSGTELIPIREIEQVRSAKDQSGILEKMVSAQKENPFRPFSIAFSNDVRWTVHRPEDLIISEKRLILVDGSEGNHGVKRIRESDVVWLDDVEILPDLPQT